MGIFKNVYLAAVSSVCVAEGPGLAGGAGVEPHPAPGVPHPQQPVTGGQRGGVRCLTALPPGAQAGPLKNISSIYHQKY